MTTLKSANILCKVKGLYLVLLCLRLTVADVPGPCRYSMRRDHLATLSHLIDNQLKNGCSITYNFTERGNLSDACYIKAAFPQILELIDTHFRFSRSSDNGRYVEATRALIHSMYSQKCILLINEEIEDDPVKFSKTHRGSPREALDRVLKVFSLYLELMSSRNRPMDWSCADEYAEDEPQFTTALTHTTDPLGQDERTHFQSKDPDESHDSNMLAYVLAPVCGGLLFMSAVYCLIRLKIGFMQHRPGAAELSISDSQV
ncbi:uncharacterized protein LOC133138178 isoform X2 [Conger conger]|uniref:uncharacterized protein LOC133138178 isoform X2 n=1 Tax=Conger conger TaxID=82655 RepID=UPI002A5AA5BD|nr:uncharacterized protein LOC133138178 isoform X2 [Conger conger]